MKARSGAVVAAGVVLLCGLGLSAPAARAETKLWEQCTTGVAAGQCVSPDAIATDPATGAVFVAELENKRISEFDVWGQFVKAWGWGVRNGAAELQTCSAQTSCQTGLGGAGDGQLNLPTGVSVDGEGNVYVVDWLNHRVQKFDPTAGPGQDEARFILMFGGDVNLTKSGGTPTETNLCTAASGDECQIGKVGVGPGQFGNWRFGSFIATGSDDDVYVGDENRIQRFDKEGDYKVSIEGPALSGETVLALAVDKSPGPTNGDLYVARCNPVNACNQGSSVNRSKPNVLRLSSSGALLGSLVVPNPQAVAIDGDRNIYVVDGLGASLEVHKFGPTGNEVAGFPFSDGIDASVGIATSSACEIPGADFYVANYSGVDSYVSAYGPPPDPEKCPPPEVAPEIDAQYPSSVDTSTATLKAQINPNFWPNSTYYVEYGTGKCSAGGCTQTQPLPPGSSLGPAVTSEDIETAGVNLEGLAPETTYHFRFVAESLGGGPVRGVGGTESADGAEGTFTTFTARLNTQPCSNDPLRSQANLNPATGLPFSISLANCRAFELVSPPEKNGADVSSGELARAFTSPRKSSADGERATYSALRAFEDPAAAPLVNQYISARGAAGWSTQSIAPPRSAVFLWPPALTGQFKAFDENLCEGWFLQDSDLALVPGAPPAVASIYKRNYCDPGAGYQLLTPVDPPEIGPNPPEIKREFYVPNPQGSSADGTHTVFRAPAKLTNNACQTPGINQVYVTNPEAPLRLVSALPPGKGGQGTCTNSTAGTFEDSTDGFRESNLVGAISSDGETVFWTDTLSSSIEGILGTGPGNLYVRKHATQQPSPISGGACTDTARACTVAISESGKARFWGANPDGTTAIYGVAVAVKEEELFEYDVASATSTLIAGGVTGVAGISEDARRVYLISTEALSGAQQNSEGDVAVGGRQNLYLHEAGAGGPLVFIATLTGPSVPETGAGAVKPVLRESRVSSDGLHLAFSAATRLTAYDNTDISGAVPDTEAYLYDAAPGGAGKLACVGCNPGGSRPQGQVSVGIGIATSIPGWQEQLHPSRLLAADGSRLLFNSLDALVPRDTNGIGDVYLWQRAANKAGCEALQAEYFVAASGGCISLISGGQGTQPSEVIDASADGRDAFFTTGVSLLPQDPAQIDLYDARIGGGFPQPPTQDRCNVDADNCRAQGQAPSAPAPTSTNKGPGNPPPPKPKCPKGKHRVTQKGKSKCVPNKKKASHKKKANKKGRAAR